MASEVPSSTKENTDIHKTITFKELWDYHTHVPLPIACVSQNNTLETSL